MNPEQLALILNLLVAVIFPIFVGVVTKTTTNPAVKAAFLATISLGSGLVSQWLAALAAGAPMDWFTAIVTGFGAWAIAIATHFGFWKPTGATEAVQAIGSK